MLGHSNYALNYVSTMDQILYPSAAPENVPHNNECMNVLVMHDTLIGILVAITLRYDWI